MDFSLPVLLALLVGKYFKEHPNVSNKLIPYLIFASQFLGRLVLDVSPAEASILGTLGHIGTGLAGIALASAATTISAVGFHSFGKNTIQGIKEKLMKLALEKLKGDV